ncbi:MAG: 3-phosphoshikimate 1-carboxyvinyltransferase [Pyrinomonadaceae bacterium]
MIIRPAGRIDGHIRLPGDKSISHRAAMIAAIANGPSRITNYSTSADCAATLICLEKLGVRIEPEGGELRIYGAGARGFSPPRGPLDCGNSGTTMRLLAGILAAHDFVSTLTGDQSLRSRPMQRIIEPLEMMGAQISARDGRAPLQIQGSAALKPIDYELLTASAQVKSCILLAGLYADGTTTVTENEVTRDHTERMLRWFGAEIEAGKAAREPENARRASVTGMASLRAREVSIPGDISSGAYFIAAAALLPQSELQIHDVGLNPTRIAFLGQLRSMGFEAKVTDERKASNEPRGDICVRASSSHGTTPFRIDGAIIPQLIDELPLLAVVGSQNQGGIEIRDAKELRVKESDRIAATVTGLRSMGCEVEEFDDGLRVDGPARLRRAKIDSFGDHRIAMAFAIAALIAEGDTEIDGAGCVAISFPEFFDLLESVMER